MKYVKWIGIGLLIILTFGLVGFGYASHASGKKLSRSITSHAVDFPIPWPLSEDEIDELREQKLIELAAARVAHNHGHDDHDHDDHDHDDHDHDDHDHDDHDHDDHDHEEQAEAADAALDPLATVDLDAIALERALKRGKHLMTARYGCLECHGEDLSGGVMIDDPAIGLVLGPNLTSGKGGVVSEYTAQDWDRIVRHGITRQGKPAIMPSVDFLSMSDQELSDIIVYIQSLPPVDNEVPPVKLGPLGKVLVTLGMVELTADLIDHDVVHATYPPQAAVNVEFGKHLGQVCSGCHGMDFTGGPVPGGPPDWPPTMNLTSHEDGMGTWTFEEFDTLMREGKTRTGVPLRTPMAEVIHMSQNMTEIEMEAMFLFFSTLPPKPTRK